ncbi:hypothetical protein KGQ19_36730 [Catenulispora sp. NL8]|uniref:Nucleoside 2-deoxyribosyltransferase n=1 Tax=Catenulispora pinistramenti TaxID=2705254 RepID=A0ABS5L258_9ACTN|nr:hypothetical protein [Catenulispora pinistramenti]MBS2552416.1 hypothetical protein [Catenulispora pinistramenti]
MRIFLAGVIQGGIADGTIHDQGYRTAVTAVLAPLGAQIVDPHAENPDRLSWTRRDQTSMFLRYVAHAGRCDALIAWLPQVSMGTAVEMYEAHRAGVPVLAVSPLHDNWTIFSLATRVFPDLGALASFVGSGEFERLVGSADRASMEGMPRV